VATKGMNDYRLRMSEENKLLMPAAVSDLIQKKDNRRNSISTDAISVVHVPLKTTWEIPRAAVL
jgi:hypothetical protein